MYIYIYICTGIYIYIACVTCVFSCDWNLKLDGKWNNTSSIVCAFACSTHISPLVFVYFENGKWVTCLNYPFSGSHASAPRNWFAWEPLRLKTYKGSSGRWLPSKDARSGMDAAMPQPETHTPVLVPAWRYAIHTIVLPMHLSVDIKKMNTDPSNYPISQKLTS